MPRYIREIAYNQEYPDLPLVGQTTVVVPNLPPELKKIENLERLEEELETIANKASVGFGRDLTAVAYARQGSLLVDIFFNCELNVLLSEQNLKALKVWTNDYVVSGIQAGTLLYTTHLTFRAIKRLERGMHKICVMLKHYILVNIGSVDSIIGTKRPPKNAPAQTFAPPPTINGTIESRTGILGLLSRLYDAIDVCNSTSAIVKRADAIKRAYNAVKTLDDIAIRNEDRIFLCNLISPLVQNIKQTAPASDKLSPADKKSLNVYDTHRTKLITTMNQICGHDITANGDINGGGRHDNG